MSTYTLEQVLFDLAEAPSRADAYRHNPREFLAAYSLAPDEIELVVEMEVRTMLGRGVNPMLAMRAFTAVEGRERVPEYLKRLRRVD